jgi:hypothetical protein
MERTAPFKTEAFIAFAETPEADVVWFHYPIARAVFIGKHPELYQNQSGVVRSTFGEELRGRMLLVDGTLSCLSQGKPAPSQYLADLVRVHHAGFLKQYVWCYCNLPFWPDAGVPDKLLNFIAWARVNLATHTLETHGGVRIDREDSRERGPDDGFEKIDVQQAGGKNLVPVVAQITSLIQRGDRSEVERLLVSFRKSAKDLQTEADATYCCFASQRQLDYFLCCQSGSPKIRVMDGSVARGCHLSAYVLSKYGRFVEALTEVDMVLKLAPFFAQGWHEKAYILTKLRRPSEALAVYNEAWKLILRHPENFNMAGPILRGQAVALVELGELDRAEKLLRDSLVVDPEDVMAVEELAYIAQRRNGFAPGKTYFVTRSVEKAPSTNTKARAFIVGEDGLTRVDYR